MDFAHFNWGLYGLAVFGILFILWIVRLLQTRPGWSAAIISFAHLVVAGLNGPAPIRGYVDPAYIGYSFGYIHTPGGILTTLAAGATFIAAALSAFIAVRNRSGAMMWFVAATSLFFTLNVGVAWAVDALHNIAANTIQFGEYLTIPGIVATPILFVLLVVPFAYGIVWSARRATAKA